MKTIIKWITLILDLFTVILLNPLWPIWGNEIKVDYENGLYLTNTPSSLGSFLQNANYSGMNHFSAIFGLICLYLGSILLIVSIVIYYIKKKNNFYVSLSSSILLLVSSIFLPFSCDYKGIPFVFYCIIPFACAISIFLCDIVFNKIKKDQNSLYKKELN